MIFLLRKINCYNIKTFKLVKYFKTEVSYFSEFFSQVCKGKTKLQMHTGNSFSSSKLLSHFINLITNAKLFECVKHTYSVSYNFRNIVLSG